MKLTNSEKNTAAAAAKIAAPKGFTSGYDLGFEIAGVSVSAAQVAARLRETLEKARVIEKDAEFPAWKALEDGLQKAKNDGRLKFDRESIERGIVARYDQEKPKSIVPADRDWVSMPLKLGIANMAAFHAMSKQARATLTPEDVRKDLSSKLSNALGQAWKVIVQADGRNRGVTRTKPETSTDPKTQIGSAKVVELLQRVKKAQEDGFEIPADVQRAARTLVMWVTGKSAKTPKTPKTTVTEIPKAE